VTCPHVWRPGTEGDLGSILQPATDDHPFLYLQNRTIPGLYVITVLFILLASLILIRAAGGSMRGAGLYVDLLFMGMAFLLIETKSVVQFALLFGTTWLVNALVFAEILLSVFAAIEVARHVRLRRPGLLYEALLASLALARAIPAEKVLAFGFVGGSRRVPGSPSPRSF
jgi:hypothetical protein